MISFLRSVIARLRPSDVESSPEVVELRQIRLEAKRQAMRDSDHRQAVAERKRRIERAVEAAAASDLASGNDMADWVMGRRPPGETP